MYYVGTNVKGEGIDGQCWGRGGNFGWNVQVKSWKVAFEKRPEGCERWRWGTDFSQRDKWQGWSMPRLTQEQEAMWLESTIGQTSRWHESISNSWNLDLHQRLGHPQNLFVWVSANSVYCRWLPFFFFFLEENGAYLLCLGIMKYYNLIELSF